MTRLKNLPTLRIDAGRSLAFTYRGKSYRGVAGDTVATALYANGVRVFGRSLKYHRPRGLYSLDGECSNAMVEVDGVPNVRAETTLLAAGMTVKPQNVKGSPEFDLMGFMDALSWAMPAGFYYRVFHKPARLWPTAIKQIRQAAGLGTLSPDFRMKGRFDEIYPAADVCVIGGGPAGMAAALAAAGQGLRVILLESRPRLGGAFEYRAAADRDGDTAVRTRSRARTPGGERAQHPRLRPCPGHRRLHGRPGHGLPARRPGAELRRALHRNPRPRRRGGDRLHRAAAAVREQRAAGRHAGRMRAAARPHLGHPAGPGGGLQRRPRPGPGGRDRLERPRSQGGCGRRRPRGRPGPAPDRGAGRSAASPS